MYRVITGDEVGLVKSVGLGNGWGLSKDSEKAANGKVLGRVGECSREFSVEQMCWADSNDWERGVLTLNRQGDLELLRDLGPKGKTELLHNLARTGDVIKLWEAKEDTVAAGLESFNGRVVACSDKGLFHIAKLDLDAKEGKSFEGGLVKTFDVKRNVAKMRLNPFSGFFATGGKQSDLTMWDLEQEKDVFKAKNVANDFLDLEVPVWITDMCFLPVVQEGKGPSKSITGLTPEKIVTCTAYSQVRVYDTRAQRRPVLDACFDSVKNRSASNASTSSKHMNCIVACDPDSVVVGDAGGDVLKIDLRTMKVAGIFKPFAGSVRSLAKHPSLPLLASAGIDRHVRVHDINTRKLVSSVYVKQRMKTILFTSEGALKKKEASTKATKRSKAENVAKQQQLDDEEDVIEPLSEDDDAEDVSLPNARDRKKRPASSNKKGKKKKAKTG